jgi:hypothetical protein
MAKEVDHKQLEPKLPMVASSNDPYDCSQSCMVTPPTPQAIATAAIAVGTSPWEITNTMAATANTAISTTILPLQWPVAAAGAATSRMKPCATSRAVSAGSRARLRQEFQVSVSTATPLFRCYQTDRDPLAFLSRGKKTGRVVPFCMRHYSDGVTARASAIYTVVRP